MITKIDQKDRKILFELEQNSRQSLKEIAGKVRLKKETVFHRIKCLEKQGIIKSYLTEIDVYRIGYQFYPVLIKYQNTTPRIEEDIYQFLLKHQYTAWLTKCEGAWDINLTLIARSNLEVSEFVNEFLSRYSRYISDKHIFITTEIYYFKRGFWIGQPTTRTVGMGRKKVIGIQKEDLRLLAAMSKEARKSLVNIGKILRIKPKNVAYRLKKLEKEQVIQGYRVLVDFSKIGYKFYKIWFALNQSSKENFFEMLQYCGSHPNIIWATKTTGYYDFSIEMEVEDTEVFRRVLNDIKAKFSDLIKKHESLLIFEEGTMNYLPPYRS